MITRSATINDVPAVVEVHLASFKGFFLSLLGPRFLRVLYTQMIASPVGVVLVSEDNGRVAGFVGGVTQQSGFYRQLVKDHKWQFALSCSGAVLRNPTIIGRLWRALRKPAEATESSADACLMSIGVLPATEGKGIGRALAGAFCDELRSRGTSSVCLTTDKTANDRTNKFYQSMGFLIAREYTTAEGRQMYEYQKRLD